MRLAAYAGASTALAVGVVLYAFNQRTNFYSACVYLAQSNLCLMILTNLILFIVAAFMFGLQRALYGPLRPIEIEQLYEKAWFAVTETCLAMTIFRDEVGAWFLVMFVGLLVGKVWGWIGEGRVEVLEQQPPANPRLFHIRLSVSLALSLLYDIWLLAYTTNTVIQQARPNMMVMFLFELAVLLTSSTSTALRYTISLIDARIVKKQTQERLEARRAEVRAERERIVAERASAAAVGATEEGTEVSEPLEELPSEDDIDEMDIEVPGWEAKGQVVLSLDLATDFVKLVILMAFFFILLTFYGLPIHIIRDLFLTARSFVKRLTAFVKYRRATRDMNSRYPDATAEEIEREDTCIICREEMRPWAVTNPADPVPNANGVAAPNAVVNERSRPKKLPCGHVLHLGCLKSWLERQQVCPTCRRPVVGTGAVNPTPGGNAGGQAAGGGQPQPPGVPPVPGAGRRNMNMRQFGFGPLRFAFGQANLQDVVQGMNNGDGINDGQPGNQNGGPGAARMYGLEFGFPRRQAQIQAATTQATNNTGTITEQLHQIEQRIHQEVRSLQASQQELQIFMLLQMELDRLRQARGNPTEQTIPNANPAAFPPLPNEPQVAAGLPSFPQLIRHNNAGVPTPPPANISQPATGLPPFPQFVRHNAPVPSPPMVQRHGAVPGVSAIPSGSSDLPPGVSIPEGWSLLPLARLDGALAPEPTVAGPVVSQTPSQTSINNPASEPRVSSSQIISPTPTRIPSDVLSQNNDQSAESPAESSNTHPPALRESTTEQPSQAQEPPTANPSTVAEPPQVPQWGSGTHPLLAQLRSTQSAQAPAAGSSTQESVLGPQSDSASDQDQPSTSKAGNEEDHTKDKGKGKAATVEETVDESEK